MYQDYSCPMCGKDVDSQSHALACQVVAQHFTEEEKESLSIISYDDIFGNIDQQVAITKMFNKIISIKQNQIAYQ